MFSFLILSYFFFFLIAFGILLLLNIHFSLVFHNNCALWFLCDLSSYMFFLLLLFSFIYLWSINCIEALLLAPSHYVSFLGDGLCFYYVSYHKFVMTHKCHIFLHCLFDFNYYVLSTPKLLFLKLKNLPWTCLIYCWNLLNAYWISEWTPYPSAPICSVCSFFYI